MSVILIERASAGLVVLLPNIENRILMLFEMTFANKDKPLAD